MVRPSPFRAARRAAALALALLAPWLAPALARAADAPVPGELLVHLADDAALPALLQKHRLTLRARFGSRPIYRLGLVGNASLDAKLDALALEPAVLDAEPNLLHRSPEARKNVVWAIGSASAYAAQWAPTALRLAEAHRLATGAGVRVAVLDTGVDPSHPALAGRLLPGFDFVDLDTDPREQGPGLAFGHGTHLAALVALAAPGARIVPLRVLDRDGQGNAWVLAEAMLRAVDPDGNPATADGAHVINLSAGSLERSSILTTVARLAACAPPDAGEPDLLLAKGYESDRQRCAQAGAAVLVAAAGNDASDRVRQYPAAASAYGLIAVTASAQNQRLAAFANSGHWIDLAAPGDRITSAVPGGWGTWSGTSMAAPLAAGVAALLRQARPALAPEDVVRRLVDTTAPLCGTRLRQLDALQALDGRRSTRTVSCP